MKKITAIALGILLAVSMLTGTALADETTRPTLILESYTIEGDVAAGRDIILMYTLRNTSQATGVSNILFSIRGSSSVFYPSDGLSNQYFVRSIPAGGTYTGEAHLTVSKNVQDGVYSLEYDIAYQGSTESVLSSSGYVAIEISGMALQVLEINLPEQCVADRVAFLSVRYVNSGKDELRGVRVILEGSIGEDELEIPVGIVRSGAVGVVEGHVTFHNTGEQTLRVYLAYENESGEAVISEPVSLLTTVTAGTAGVGISQGDPTESGEETGVGGFVHETGIVGFVRENATIVVCGFIVVCVLVIVISVLIKRKRR